MADQKKRTLEDSDIVSNHDAEKEVSRRSMLGAVGTIALGGAASTVMAGCYRRAVVVGPRAPNAVVVAPQVQYQQQQQWSSGITDSDGGPYADPAGNGRGGTRQQCSGLTDADGGAYADPANCGRGRRGMTTGFTDSDGGPYADPAGNGRGGSMGRTGITDSDPSDPAGFGRGRHWR